LKEKGVPIRGNRGVNSLKLLVKYQHIYDGDFVNVVTENGKMKQNATLVSDYKKCLKKECKIRKDADADTESWISEINTRGREAVRLKEQEAKTATKRVAKDFVDGIIENVESEIKIKKPTASSSKTRINTQHKPPLPVAAKSPKVKKPVSKN
jgi:hypothetical protein